MTWCPQRKSSTAPGGSTLGLCFPLLLTRALLAGSHTRLSVSRAVGLLRVTVVALLGSSVFAPPVMAQTCAANAFLPHINGMWKTLPYLMSLNPISATLLHTGQVLIVAGSENDAQNNAPGAESYRNALWDPTGTTQSSITVQH